MRNLGTAEGSIGTRIEGSDDVRSCDDRTVETSESAQVTNDLTSTPDEHARRALATFRHQEWANDGRANVLTCHREG